MPHSYILSKALKSGPYNFPDFKLIILAGIRPAGAHLGRYNAPRCNEVAILITGLRKKEYCSPLPKRSMLFTKKHEI